MVNRLHGAGTFFKSLYWGMKKKNSQILCNPQVTQNPTTELVQSKSSQTFLLDLF